MASYSRRWQAFNTTIRVGTTRPDGLEPAGDAVRALLSRLGSSDMAVAADLASRAAMRAARSGGVLVSIGTDVATAGDAPAGGWQIPVRDFGDEPEAGAADPVIAIRSGAVATSSATGPTQWRSVTVTARTCVAAETAATAALTKDDFAVEWLQRRRFAARLVESDGTIHYIGRWPDPTRDAA